MRKRELSLDEVKAIELKLLVEFDRICTQRNFRYSLGGGTLLGAVRHKGFIPWDDDVDVIMPRPDYDRFIEYARTECKLPFIVQSYEIDEKYINPYAKVYMPNTVMYKKESANEHGIYIDIFPLEGLGDSFQEAKKIFYRTAFDRELLNAVTWKRFVRSRTHSWYYEPIRFALFLISRFVDEHKLLEKIDTVNRKYEFDKCRFAGCVCGSYRINEIVPQADLAEYAPIEFEGRCFQAIKSYENYLTKHYGDYMKLPPVEKRVTHHGFTAYIIEEG